MCGLMDFELPRNAAEALILENELACGFPSRVFHSQEEADYYDHLRFGILQFTEDPGTVWKAFGAGDWDDDDED